MKVVKIPPTKVHLGSNGTGDRSNRILNISRANLEEFRNAKYIRGRITRLSTGENVILQSYPDSVNESNFYFRHNSMPLEWPYEAWYGSYEKSDYQFEGEAFFEETPEDIWAAKMSMLFYSAPFDMWRSNWLANLDCFVPEKN